MSEVQLSYHIDRANVPAWIDEPAITLIVQVGPALDVVAHEDGVLVECVYDGERAYVTTSGEDIELLVAGPQSTLDEMGDVSVAALRGDKDWALSITLDDGFECQATTAKELLDRYGYAATIAVVGGRIGIDFNGDRYASAEQLQAVVEDGWHLANHTYTHHTVADIGTETQVVDNIQAANQAIMDAVPGYVPSMFTSPFVDVAFEPIIQDNVDELGLHFLQTLSWEGKQVDAGVFHGDPEGVGRIGRTQLLHDASQFDQVQEWIAREPGTHWWLSLHTHDVVPACDCVETSIDKLYYTYGAGGIDNVWVAPAPEVYQYLLVRDSVVVSETDREFVGEFSGAGPQVGDESSYVTQTLRLQHGLNGYAGTRDATIDQYNPDNNRGHDGGLAIRTLNGLQGLISFELDALPENAIIDRAVLYLHGASVSNEVIVCLDAHRLLEPWDEMQVTWNQRTDQFDWQVPGAMGIEDATTELVGLRGLVPEEPGWYDVDISEAVAYWAAHPAENYGLLIKGSGEGSRHVSMASSEYDILSKRPILDITYHLPEVVIQDSPPAGAATLVGGLVFDERGNAPSERWATPVTVTLQAEDEPSVHYVMPTISGPSGEFIIDQVVSGTYTMTVATQSALDVVLPEVVIHDDLTVLDLGVPVLGDVTHDGLVSARDWATLMASFDAVQGEPGYAAATDLDADGAIGVLDLTVLQNNYGRYGPLAKARPVVALSQTVDIVIEPAIGRASVGQPYVAQVVLQAGDQLVNGLDVTLAFDDVALALLDVTVGDNWPVQLAQSELDGQDGTVRLVLASPSGPLSGTIDVASLRFEPLEPTQSGGGSIHVAGSSDSSASVTAYGVDVTGDAQNAQVVVTDPEAFVPLIRKGPSVTGTSAVVRTEGAALREDAVQLPVVGSLALPVSSFEARDVRLAGDLAYMAVATFYHNNDGDPFFYVVDVSDVTAPSAFGSVNRTSREPDELWIEEDRAYVARKGFGADIIDITAGVQPSWMGSFFCTTEDRPIAKGLHVYQQRMYIADERYGLQIVDVSDGTTPYLMGSYDHEMFGEGVWSDGVTAYVAADRDEEYRPVVYALDVTNPWRPHYLTQLIPPETNGRAVDVQLDGDTLYVAAENGGVCAFDVSDPSNPVFMDALTTEFAQKLDVDGNRLFVADDVGGLLVVDISEPSALSLVGYHDTLGKAYGVCAQDGYAYVADGDQGLQIIDLGPLDPTPTPTMTPTPVPTMTPSPTPRRYDVALPMMVKSAGMLSPAARR